MNIEERAEHLVSKFGNSSIECVDEILDALIYPPNTKRQNVQQNVDVLLI